MKNYLLILAILLVAATADTSAQFTVKSKSVDLRPQIQQFGLAVRSQVDRPTCTIFATTFLIEYMTAKEKGAPGANFSEEYLNAMSDRVGGNKNDGSFFSDALEGYEQFGVVVERQAQYKSVFDPDFLQGTDAATLGLIESGKENRMLEGELIFSPHTQGLTDDQINTILKYIEAGTPVAVGHSGPSAGELKLSDLGGGHMAFDDYDIAKTAYAHSVPLVGYTIDPKVNGGGYVIFRNSGGPGWGDAGYGYMTLNYLKKFTYDGLVMKKSLVSSDILKDKDFINKRILKRKDILRQVTNKRALVKTPFITSDKLTQLNLRVRGKG